METPKVATGDFASAPTNIAGRSAELIRTGTTAHALMVAVRTVPPGKATICVRPEGETACCIEIARARKCQQSTEGKPSPSEFADGIVSRRTDTRPLGFASEAASKA